MPGRHQKRTADDCIESSSSHKRVAGTTGESQSSFVTILLRKWAWGLSSANDVQELAMGCLTTLKNNNVEKNEPELKEVASCGAWGAAQGNINRDLLRKFAGNCLVPEPIKVKVPCVNPKVDANIKTDKFTSIIFPSQWLHALSSETSLKDKFSSVFGVGALERFWSSVSPNDPKLTVAMTSKQNWKSKTIPLLLHGDGAEYMDRDSLLSVSFSGLLKEGSIKESNLLLTSWVKSCTYKKDTWQCLWQHIADDFEALLQNTFPNRDPYPIDLRGKQILKQGYCAVLWQIQGDMDYLQNELGLPHWRVEHPNPLCSDCGCNKEDLNWFNFKPDAPWMTTPSAWVGRHPLFSISRISAENVAYDWLHVVDLGVSCHALGNLLFDIIVANNGPADA